MAKAKAGFLFTGITGTVGTSTFMQTRYGTVVREASERGRKSTPPMVAAQDRMRIASRAFRNLSRAEAERWNNYGKTLAAPDPDSGIMVSPSGQQAFNAQATKLLQLDPGQPFPRHLRRRPSPAMAYESPFPPHHPRSISKPMSQIAQAWSPNC